MKIVNIDNEIEKVGYKVEPIKDLTLLEDMCEYLKVKNDRDFTLLMTGLYSGLRISDILKLQVRHVKNAKRIRIYEEKTNKYKEIELNSILKKVFKSYCKDKKDNEYLFKSRKGYNQPITRNRAYVILSEMGEHFGVDSIGSHTMRKTFGYHYYKQTKDIAFLMKIFNHSTPTQTLDYIGMTQESINRTYRTFKYSTRM